MAITIVSVNIALPKTFQMDDGEEFQTAIFKSSTEEKVWARGNALEGDRPADEEFHGGAYQAVYSYAAEHYPYWKQELASDDLPFGAFGENITTEGLEEAPVFIGDQFRFGEALLEATAPRIPCETLGFRFKDQTIVKKFMHSGRMGIYFRIIEEGRLQKGDAITIVKRRTDTAPVLDIAKALGNQIEDKGRIKELSQLEGIPPTMREQLRKRLPG